VDFYLAEASGDELCAVAKFSTMVYDLTVNELFDENSRRTRARRSPWTVLDEYAAVLKVAADGFVKLLQMSVLPYVAISIITGVAGGK
jgi:L-cystine uptake protein TcyP (sodium:dicarboxylate symporter family)